MQILHINDLLSIQDACHNAAHFLMDISDVRADGNMVLTLPDPLLQGEEERKTGDGSKIWNPLFNVAKPLQQPANQAFIKAVVETVVETQKVRTHCFGPIYIGLMCR